MDLNVIIEEDGERDSREVIIDKLNRCKTLGFTSVALAVVVTLKKNSLPIPPPPHDIMSIAPSRMQVFTRLTARIRDRIDLHKLNHSDQSSNYDLIAVESHDASTLQQICTGNVPLDILTFNFSRKVDFTIFKNNFKALQKRGVCFEINYGPAQMGASLRRNIICNGQNIAEKVVKNVILSSGIRDPFRLRSPEDAKNLGALFLLPLNKRHAAVYTNGLRSIQLSRHRKNPTCRAIEQIN